MTKISSRTKRARAAQKLKRSKPKAKKTAARTGARAKTPVAKTTRAKAKPAARPTKALKSTVWPGLPPGYFDRGR